MGKIADAFSLMPNPADSNTLDHQPTRKDLDDWCHRVMEELIVYARFRYGSTEFKDIAPLDENELRGYFTDALNEATAKAWRELR